MTRINKKDLNDHQELIDLIDEGIAIINNIYKRFNYADQTDMYDIDIIKYCMYQLSILNTAYVITKDNKYIESFMIIRSSFEQYFRILLMSKGRLYPHDYYITEKDKPKQKNIYRNTLKKIKKAKKENRISHVLDIIEYKYNKIRVIREGPFSKSEGKLIPAYYLEYKNHQPRKVFVDNLKTFRDIEPDGISAQKWIKHHGKIYKKFIRFDPGVKDGLILNNEIDESGWDRIVVHYNFMSLFTHADHNALDATEGRNKTAKINKFKDYRKFDHYISELCFLYILRLLEYYIRLIFLHESTSYIISNIEELHSYVTKVKNKTKYLYFISDNPHELDKINFRTNGLYYKMVSGKRTKAVHIYYEDPLKRLEQMHTSFYEITTRDVFDSPFK